MSRQNWMIAAGKTASATFVLAMALGAGQAAAQSGYTAFPVPQQAPAPAESVYLGGQQAEGAENYVIAQTQMDPAGQVYMPAPMPGYAPLPQGYGAPAYGAPAGYAPMQPHAPHAPVEFDYGVSDASQTVYLGDSNSLGYGVPAQPHAPHGYGAGQDTVYYEAPASYPTYPAYPSAPAPAPEYAAPAPAPEYTAPAAPAPEYAAPAPAAQPAAPVAEAPASVNHYVQLGAFTNTSNAEKLVREMTARGENVFIDPTTVNDRTFHRVRVGPIASREDAWAALNRVRGLGYGDARVVRN